MFTKGGEMVGQISLKESNKHILDGLTDLLKVLNDYQVNYRIFGSVLTTAAVGVWFRELGDVEVLLDKDKKEMILQALKAEGYSEVKREEMEKAGHRTINQASNGDVLGLQKGKTVLSLHFAEISDSGAIIQGKAGFSARFPSEAITPTMSTLDTYTFMTLPPETQYLMLKWKALVDGKKSKAAQDAHLLASKINEQKAKSILKQKPGIYLRNRVLPMRIIFAMVGFKNRVLSV